jgi:hypothetical protein
MNDLRDMIRPWVQNDTQKLATMDQFEKAMTSTDGGASSGPQAGMAGAAPALEPFIQARLTAVATQLASQPSTSAVTVAASPVSLSFTQASGGKAPAAQTVALSADGGAAPASYKVSTGDARLSVAPVTGALPGSISVSVSGSSLAPGKYTGGITVTSPGAGAPLSIPVMLAIS